MLAARVRVRVPSPSGAEAGGVADGVFSGHARIFRSGSGRDECPRQAHRRERQIRVTSPRRIAVRATATLFHQIGVVMSDHRTSRLREPAHHGRQRLAVRGALLAGRLVDIQLLMRARAALEDHARVFGLARGNRARAASSCVDAPAIPRAGPRKAPARRAPGRAGCHQNRSAWRASGSRRSACADTGARFCSPAAAVHMRTRERFSAARHTASSRCVQQSKTRVSRV